MLGLSDAMEVLIGVLLIAATAAYLASLGCRFARWRQRIPCWYLAHLSAAGAGLIFIFTFCGHTLFKPSEWDSGKVHAMAIIPVFFLFAICIGLIPGFLVVSYYRKKFQRHAQPSSEANAASPRRSL
jgi:hypothetical protein